jgi:hypothetical protein
VAFFEEHNRIVDRLGARIGLLDRLDDHMNGTSTIAEENGVLKLPELAGPAEPHSHIESKYDNGFEFTIADNVRSLKKQNKPYKYMGSGRLVVNDRSGMLRHGCGISPLTPSFELKRLIITLIHFYIGLIESHSVFCPYFLLSGGRIS